MQFSSKHSIRLVTVAEKFRSFIALNLFNFPPPSIAHIVRNLNHIEQQLATFCANCQHISYSQHKTRLENFSNKTCSMLFFSSTPSNVAIFQGNKVSPFAEFRLVLFLFFDFLLAQGGLVQKLTIEHIEQTRTTLVKFHKTNSNVPPFTRFRPIALL